MGQKGLRVSDSERRLLRVWIRAGKTPQRVVRRARIVLLAAEGCSGREIARRLGVGTQTVSLWLRRFHAGSAVALMHDAPGRGRKVTVTRDAHARLRALLATSPPMGRWTVRALATAIGISRASVHRVLKASNLTLARDGDRNVGRRLSLSQPASNPECAVN